MKHVFGERRIVKSAPDFIRKVDIRLQEWRPTWLGLSGRWVTLVEDYGYTNMTGSVEDAMRRIEHQAKNPLAGSTEVAWSSKSGLEKP